MSVLVEFAMFPTDKGASVSPYVTRIIKMLRDSGTNHQLTAMGTIFETETMQEALQVIQKAHDQLEPDCDRIYSSINFDIRKGKSNRMIQKIQSIETKL